ncbi:hypothetical protein [Actinoplanes sp. NPDC049802]|uniref:hypothetical protein n=1 Tax=Actinoplanes sp. NPDC049802 TaxID=3154742 RepID=UPI0033FBAE50
MLPVAADVAVPAPLAGVASLPVRAPTGGIGTGVAVWSDVGWVPGSAVAGRGVSPVFAGAASLPVRASAGDDDLGAPEPPGDFSPMAVDGVSGTSVPPYSLEPLPGVAAPADLAAEPPDADDRSPGAVPGAGFGVPALRGGSAWPDGMPAGGGVGFGVPGLPERAGCPPVGELLPAAGSLPAAGPEPLADAVLVVTVVREPGPGVTVL